MTIRIPRGESDEIIEQIIAGLRPYLADRPKAKIDVYRQNRFSVRIRIIDPGFAKLGTAARHDIAWGYLEKIPDEAQSDISTLLLLAPAEVKKSFANVEFEDPVPSPF